MSVISKASLVQIPSGYGEDKLYSEVPNTTNGDFTFTRASTGTRVNADGYIEEVPWNLNTYSEDFTNASYIKDSGITIASTNNLSPIGNNTATQIDVTNSGRIYKNVTSAQYRTSVYLKAGTFAYFKFANSQIDLNLGTINSPYSSSIEDVGNGWYRISVSHPTTIRPFQVQAYPDNTYTTHTQSGNYFIWGSMLNYGDTTKPYIKTTDRLDVPRLDYSGGATCPTLLLEPQRTNLNIQSNSSFGVNACTIDYNNATSPEGITNAYRATATGTSASFVRSLNISFTDPSAFSMFLKHGNNEWIQIINAGNVNHYVNVNIENGDLGTFGSNTSDLLVEDYGNGWYRVSGKFSGWSGLSTLRAYMTNSSSNGWAANTTTIGNYYYGYGFQVESNASYATSYIPTSGSTTTRTSDSFQSVNASNWSSVEGTINLNLQAFEGDNTYRQFSLYGSGNDSLVISYTNTTNQVTSIMKVGGSTVFYMATTLTDASDLNKIAFAYSSGRAKLFINGVQRGTSSASYTTSEGVWTKFCSNIGASYNYYFGKVDGIYISKTALTDEELTTLTTI